VAAPPQDADAVVIGAGALGSSIAYHLARLGWTKTVLLDRHDLASQTSPRAAGLSAQLPGSDLMTTLARRGVQKIRSFTKDTGEALISTQRQDRSHARPRVAAPRRRRTWAST
jgi:4-methylaminobutanoate oxidase (formaldehyde-forming)